MFLRCQVEPYPPHQPPKDGLLQPINYLLLGGWWSPWLPAPNNPACFIFTLIDSWVWSRTCEFCALFSTVYCLSLYAQRSDIRQEKWQFVHECDSQSSVRNAISFRDLLDIFSIFMSWSKQTRRSILCLSFARVRLVHNRELVSLRQLFEVNQDKMTQTLTMSSRISYSTKMLCHFIRWSFACRETLEKCQDSSPFPLNPYSIGDMLQTGILILSTNVPNCSKMRKTRITRRCRV